MGTPFSRGISAARANLGLEKTALNRLETMIQAGALSPKTLGRLPSQARGLNSLYQRRKSPYVLTPNAADKRDGLLQGLRARLYEDPRPQGAPGNWTRPDLILSRQTSPLARLHNVRPASPGEVPGLTPDDAGQADPHTVSLRRGAKSPLSRAYRSFALKDPVAPGIEVGISTRRKPVAVYNSGSAGWVAPIVPHEAAERTTMHGAATGRLGWGLTPEHMAQARRRAQLQNRSLTFERQTGVTPLATHEDVLPNLMEQVTAAKSPAALGSLHETWGQSRSPLERRFTRLMKSVYPSATGEFSAGAINDPLGSRAVRALRRRLIREMQSNPGYYSSDLGRAFAEGAFGMQLHPELENYLLPRVSTYARHLA